MKQIRVKVTEETDRFLVQRSPCRLSVELQVCGVLQVTASLEISVSRSYKYLTDWWREEEKLMSAVYSL